MILNKPSFHDLLKCVGRMEVEKQWRKAIAIDVKSLVVKGLQAKFDAEMKKREGLVHDSWFDFIDEMKKLFLELKDFFSRNDVAPNVHSSPSRRTTSEPNLDSTLRDNLLIDGVESHHVWKIINSYESIIREQRKLSLSSCLNKRSEDINTIERKIENAITMLENFTNRNRGQEKRRTRTRRRMVPKAQTSVSTSTAVQSFDTEIKKIQEERDELRLQVSLVEDTYQLLFRGGVEDFKPPPPEDFCCSHVIRDYTESLLREDIYTTIFQETINEWKKIRPQDLCENVLATFGYLVDNFEVELHQNLDRKFLRLEALKRQVDSLSQPLAMTRTRKLMYEKALISRSCNLKLAESEVDLLGDQVETLLSLLERIYLVLNRNKTFLSGYFKVYDILKLIEIELTQLNGGRSSKPNLDSQE